jgi:hypothetical protein
MGMRSISPSEHPFRDDMSVTVENHFGHFGLALGDGIVVLGEMVGLAV